MHRRLRCLLLAAALLLGATLLFGGAVASAQEEVRRFAIKDIWFQKKGDGYAVNADLQVGAPQLLDQMLRGGYPVELHFTLYFYQRQSWLPDPVVGDISWRGVLAYDALKSYISLTVGGREQRFASLAEAIAEVNDLRASASNDAEYIKLLERNDIYLRARFNLHTENLPLPLQIGGLVDNEWQVDSGWENFFLEVRE